VIAFYKEYREIYWEYQTISLDIYHICILNKITAASHQNITYNVEQKLKIVPLLPFVISNPDKCNPVTYEVKLNGNAGLIAELMSYDPKKH
jgi:hypothetical protein